MPALRELSSMDAKHRRFSKAGFTLAEIVIAAGVLMATLAAFLTAFVKAQQSSLLADERIKAVHLNRQNMELLLTNTYWSSAFALTNRPNWTTNLNVVGTVTTRFVCGYAVTTSVYPTARIIIVSNQWYDMISKRTNSVSVSTAITSGFQY